MKGTAWYFRSFDMPQGASGKHVELQFAATFYSSRVGINGIELGAHEGGHTAYWVHVTPHLCGQNLIAVELNSEPAWPRFRLRHEPAGGDNVWYDWWHYGGIVRDVFLRVTDSVMVRRRRANTLRQAGQSEAEFTFRVDQPRLWHFDRPEVYRIRATVGSIRSTTTTGSAPLKYETASSMSTASVCV